MMAPAKAAGAAVIIGADPGVGVGYKVGALFAVSEGGSYLGHIAMPSTKLERHRAVDPSRVSEWAAKMSAYPGGGSREVHAYVETLGFRPRESRRSLSTSAHNRGLLCAGLIQAGCIMHSVDPRAWKRELCIEGEDKSASVRYVAMMYPHINYMLYTKSGKAMDGVGDAGCIALAGRRFMADGGVDKPFTL